MFPVMNAVEDLSQAEEADTHVPPRPTRASARRSKLRIPGAALLAVALPKDVVIDSGAHEKQFLPVSMLVCEQRTECT